MKEAHKGAPFLYLPAEIRKRIGYVLSSGFFIFPQNEDAPKRVARDKSHSKHNRHRS